VNSTGAPEISVLIVTYNNAATINDCICALRKQSYQSLEILVWDNASIDSTAESVRLHPDIQLTNSPKNFGFGKAMNKLVEKARGEFLFILNPDCLCPPQTLELLVQFAQSHPGAISPALVFPDGAIQPSARQLPHYWNLIFSRRSPLGILGWFDSQKAGFIIPDKPSTVPVVPATALFIQKALFNDIGRFDERFFLYFEDVDLCRKLQDRGILVWYLPDLRITHLLRISSRKNPIKSLYYHHRSLFKYFTKYHKHEYIKNSVLFVMLVVGFIFSAIVSLIGKRN
jgi:GT2 family glycosyltransferase